MIQKEVAPTMNNYLAKGGVQLVKTCDLCNIYLTVDLELKRILLAKKIASTRSRHRLMINILMEILEALTIRMGAMAGRGSFEAPVDVEIGLHVIFKNPV